MSWPRDAEMAMEPNTDDRPQILIVDDSQESRSILQRILSGYRTSVAGDGAEALKLLDSQPAPDLALLEIMLPEVGGFEICRRMKADERLREIPVVFITGLSEVEHEARAFELGAVDYITKPFSPAVVRARVRTHLALQEAREELTRQNLVLEEQVLARTGQLEDALKQLRDGSLETIIRLCRAAEYKDEDTGEHVLRMGYLAAAVARRLHLAESEVEALLRAAPMHDIGKIGVPDHILLKPGKLDANEWQVMTQHTGIGGRILAGSTSHVIQLAQVVALTHHEKWDGTGYPGALKGEAIPLPGRIVAVADVFDALTSRRPYKEAFSFEQSFGFVRKNRSIAFDPRVADAFLAIESEVIEIKASYPDRVASPLVKLTGTAAAT
jgi:putative two-component system response regulator